MTYQDTLDYIFLKLPMYSRVGGDAIKNGLDNIWSLCEALGNPHKKGQFIHVAGTNGKGSVSHMLASILQYEGYKTGLYTSPHLKDFRERIKIDGHFIEEKEVVDFINKIKPLIDKIKPSFFEITVAMAFDYFYRRQTTIAVVETGLGGRLDSTNIIQPLLSVITNIGYDHMQFLGNTLPAIAEEKAGIIKPQIPVVIGETHPETAPVFVSFAKKNKASISFADKHFQVEDWAYNNNNELIIKVGMAHSIDHKKYRLDLTGNYQIKNLLTVLASCKELNQMGLTISEKAIIGGLRHTKKNTGLHGRWETIAIKPRIILDVAHNLEGMQQLLNQLEITICHQLHIVLGMANDKEINEILSILPKTARYYFSNAHIPRALKATVLHELAISQGLEGNVYDHVNSAIAAAKMHAHIDDLIVICGSVFLVGEVSI